MSDHKSDLLKNATSCNCLFCKSENIETFPAKMSPFIKARTGAKETIFNFIHCKNCGAAFYDYRYDEQETNKIYNGYRGEEYQKSRQKYETWYTKEINSLIGNDPKAIVSRNKNLTQILEKNIDIKAIKTVLDYGGDKGQYIPEILNHADRFVFEISGNTTINNVRLFTDIHNCQQNSPDGYDLILCNHVFEHLSDPLETLLKIKSLMKVGGYLYIEVPFDSPFYKQPFENIQYLFNKHFKIKDIVKKFFETISTKHVLMHEHINFYTKEAINHLLISNGFCPVFLETKRIYSVIGISKIISGLYVLNETDE